MQLPIDGSRSRALGGPRDAARSLCTTFEERAAPRAQERAQVLELARAKVQGLAVVRERVRVGAPVRATALLGRSVAESWAGGPLRLEGVPWAWAATVDQSLAQPAQPPGLAQRQQEQSIAQRARPQL